MEMKFEGPASAPLNPRVALLSILGFWLFYFAVVTLRSALIGFDDQLSMLGRRALVTLVSMAVTYVFYILLRRGAPVSLGRSIAAAAVLAIPAAVIYSTVNWYAFDDIDKKNEQAYHGHQKKTTSVVVSRPSVPDVPPDDGTIPEPPEPPSPPQMVTVQMGEMTKEKELTPVQLIADNSANGYFFFVAWAALYLALCYAAEVGALERRTAGLRAAAQAAELRALRYQVNPHFLFNTLNSLSSLVMTGKRAAAEQMIINLSNFFRTSLSGDPTDDVQLDEEIRLQRLYLDIEAVRFPDRLTVDIQIPETLLAACVPGLILQPLVENAVKYGVARTTRAVTIRIRAYEGADRLTLTIEDNGDAQPDTPQIDAQGTGVGLRNVRDRLTARFGDAADCNWGAMPGGGFGVTLNMPLVRNAC